MHRRCIGSGLIVLHLVHLAIMLPAGFRGFAIKGGHKLVFLNIKVSKTIALGFSADEGAFRHHQASNCGLGSIHPPGDVLDRRIELIATSNGILHLLLKRAYQFVLVPP